MADKKRLLISIPSAPNGFYSNELAWWLTAIQTQSSILDFADSLADNMSDISSRLQVRQLARKFAVGWAMEQATLQWLDASKVRDLGKLLVPDDWSIAMSPVFGMPISANRNEQVRRFLFTRDYEKDELEPSDFDAVLFIDTDNVPGRHDLHVLCADIAKEEVDIVGGVYCVEDPAGPKPLVYRLNEDGQGFDYDSGVLTQAQGLYKLDKGGLPGGCLMVKRRVFEKMWEERRTWFKDRLHDCSFEYHEIHALLEKHKDEPDLMWHAMRALANERGLDWSPYNIGSWHIGEDIWFCRMAHEMGIDVWCDTRIFWKHIKYADNKQTFLRQQKIGRDWFGRGVEALEPAATPERKSEVYQGYVAGKVAQREESAIAPS